MHATNGKDMQKKIPEKNTHNTAIVAVASVIVKVRTPTLACRVYTNQNCFTHARLCYFDSSLAFKLADTRPERTARANTHTNTPTHAHAHAHFITHPNTYVVVCLCRTFQAKLRNHFCHPPTTHPLVTWVFASSASLTHMLHCHY